MAEIIKTLLQAIRVHAEWLHYILFEYKLFYYDFWSLVHLLTGALIFVILTAYNVKKRWQKLLLLLSAFELTEAILFIAILRLFYPEKIVDVFNDIVVGMMGGLMIYYIYKKVSVKYLQYITAFFAAVFIAFVWTGTYGYQYNIDFFNSPGINWWAFLLWFAAGYGVIRFYVVFQRTHAVWFTIFSTWAIYFVALLIVEYIGYNVLELQECSHHGVKSALLFDLVHGSKALHTFYLVAPFVFLFLYQILIRLVMKCEKQLSTSFA